MRRWPFDRRGSRQGRGTCQPRALRAGQAEVAASILHGHEGSAFLGKTGCHRPGRAQGFAVHCHLVLDTPGGAQAAQEDDGVRVGRDIVNQASWSAAGGELFDQSGPTPAPSSVTTRLRAATNPGVASPRAAVGTARRANRPIDVWAIGAGLDALDASMGEGLLAA